MGIPLLPPGGRHAIVCEFPGYTARLIAGEGPDEILIIVRYESNENNMFYKPGDTFEVSTDSIGTIKQSYVYISSCKKIARK